MTCTSRARTRINHKIVFKALLQSWSKVLGQFTADDFTGRLSSDKDRASPPFLGLLSWNLSYVIFLLRDVQTKNKPFKWPDFIQRLGCGYPFRLFLVYFRCHGSSGKTGSSHQPPFQSDFKCEVFLKWKVVFMSPPRFTETLTINPPLLPTAELCLLDA